MRKRPLLARHGATTARRRLARVVHLVRDRVARDDERRVPHRVEHRRRRVVVVIAAALPSPIVAAAVAPPLGRGLAPQVGQHRAASARAVHHGVERLEPVLGVRPARDARVVEHAKRIAPPQVFRDARVALRERLRALAHTSHERARRRRAAVAAVEPFPPQLDVQRVVQRVGRRAAARERAREREEGPSRDHVFDRATAVACLIGGGGADGSSRMTAVELLMIFL